MIGPLLISAALTALWWFGGTGWLFATLAAMAVTAVWSLRSRHRIGGAR